MESQNTKYKIQNTSPKLGAKDLRTSTPSEADLTKLPRREIYIICDNVLDTYNIGSIFRLSDAVAARCVYLCGQIETPPNSRIAKASIGTDKWVPWKYKQTAVEAIEDLRKRHFASLQDENKVIKVIAIEQSTKSIDFRRADYREPVAFVVGNETEGVSKGALKLADQIVEIPMYGINKSLNVMVSLAIVLYHHIGKFNLQNP